MIYFVTETYLKNNTPITANVDVKDVTPYIRPSSDMRVQSILGSYFYTYLLAEYNAQTLNNDEEKLVEKIQPVVAWRAAENAVFGLSYQLKNKGVQVQFGDYSQNVSQGEVAFVMDHYGQMAAFFEKRLINYILENKDLFPEFTSTLNTDSDIKPVDDCSGSGDYDNTMMVI
jgi:hypothetical protein